jgi:hypothetical protein
VSQINAPDPPSARRLESWKEIAAYLGVSVRSAQLWEKERGLPVRRLPGGRRSRVHANAAELDAWLDDSGEHPAEPAAPGPASSASPPARTPRPYWRLALAVFMLLLFLGSWTLVAERQLPPPARLTIHGELLQAFDAEGNLLWDRRFPGLDPSGYPEGPLEIGKALIRDLDRDGTSEVLFEALPRHAMGETSTLHCLSADGETLWQRRSGAGFESVELDVGPAFRLRKWELVHRDGGDRLLCLAGHTPRYPMEVILLDAATGEPVGTPYRHPGHFYRWLWLDLDGDGDEELILGGINNPGPGVGHAGLAILDVPFEAGGAEPADHFGAPGPLPLAYVLFPRMDLSERLQHRAQVNLITSVANGEAGEIRVVVSIGDIAFLYYDLAYRGPGDVELLNLFTTDSFHATRQRLVESGELTDRDTETVLAEMRRIRVTRKTPDGNAPGLPD